MDGYIYSTKMCCGGILCNGEREAHISIAFAICHQGLLHKFDGAYIGPSKWV
jgi:hypothetical protein